MKKQGELISGLRVSDADFKDFPYVRYLYKDCKCKEAMFLSFCSRQKRGFISLKLEEEMKPFAYAESNK